MFHALCVAVKPGDAQEFVIDFTSAFASQHHLAIDAYSVIDLARLAPAEPVPLGGSAFKAERDEQRTAEARQKAAMVMSRMEATARARGVECQALVREGETAAVLASAAQRCDVLVCGHTAGGDASERSLLYSILKQSARPAIVVPQSSFSGQDVLIAYDGSAQAARALASFAGSGLAQSRAVHIIAFDDGSGRAKGHTDAAWKFLQRHGIAADVQLRPLVKDVGTLIVDEARRVSAGLIVMGAFGQSAVREFFLGSVTRSILDVLPMPVFLDH